MWLRNKQTGFTIVELLIVIVVIAILAAITIVAYTGVQNRAYDTTVQSDLATFAKKMELIKVDDGTYPNSLTAAMSFSFSKSAYMSDNQGYTLRYCYNSSTDSYVLMARSKSGDMYKAVNGEVSSNSYAHGYSVCMIVGLSSTNPSQNGYNDPNWAGWTN